MDQRGKKPGQAKKEKKPVGARFFLPALTVPEAHLASCTVGTGSISRG
jgi:hypothetical protein